MTILLNSDCTWYRDLDAKTHFDTWDRLLHPFYQQSYRFHCTEETATYRFGCNINGSNFCFRNTFYASKVTLLGIDVWEILDQHNDWLLMNRQIKICDQGDQNLPEYYTAEFIYYGLTNNQRPTDLEQIRQHLETHRIAGTLPKFRAEQEYGIW